MLKTRVLTAIAVLLVVLGMLFLAGPVAWAAFASAIALVSCWEWSRLCGLAPGARRVFLVASAAIAAAMAAACFAGPPRVFANIAQASFIASAYFWIFAVPAWLALRLRPEPWAAAAAGWMVVWPLWAALVVMREAGPWILLAAAALVWVADIAAYFAGRRFGRRKLAPAISPGKTWEGVAGALAGVLAYGVALALYAQARPGPLSPVFDGAGTARVLVAMLALAALSVLGDLFESWMKRGAGRKDSSALLPGPRRRPRPHRRPHAHAARGGAPAFLRMKRLTILGSTGSIGESTLDVVERHPERFEVVALAARASHEKLANQCRRFTPRYAALSDETAAERLRAALRSAGVATEVLGGPASLEQVAALAEADAVMAAVVGAAGLPGTLAAARAGKQVLLANKEALVVSGSLFLAALAQGGGTLLPIDSEHSAVFQSLPAGFTCGRAGEADRAGVRRILLTASGGPFRTTPLERLARVTPDEACAHPNWVMGRKISVDSATMMNKGLEVIEAFWLFGAAARVDRGRRPPAKRHPLDGRVPRRFGDRAARRARHAHADRLRARLARANRGGRGAGGFHRAGRARVRAGRRRPLSLRGARLSRARARRHRAGDPERGQRDRRRELPRRHARLHRDRCRHRERSRGDDGRTARVPGIRVARGPRGPRCRRPRSFAPRAPHGLKSARIETMSGAFVTLASFLVTIGVLVVVHEWGHYAVARLAGVKILRFSVGFGRPLWMRRFGPDRTEWAIGVFPLGGYVKMLDSHEGELNAAERARAFDLQPVGKRIAIALAGPAANFIAAFLLYWALFVTGIPGVKPVVGDPPRSTAAAAAGLANGDTIRAVGGEPTATWTDVRWLLLKEAVRGGEVALELEGPGGGRVTRTLDVSTLTKEDLDRDFLQKLGLKAFAPRVPAFLGRIVAGGAGERAGLREGDRIVAIDREPVATWGQFTARVRASAGRMLAIEVERGANRISIAAVPEAVGEGAASMGLLKVEPGAEVRREWERMTTTVKHGPLAAIPKAIHRVWDLSVFSLRMLGKMVLGEVSWKNLSGPITIADYAGQSAQLGWVSFAGFLALVSVSLGVLNLLPIPLLDGGHLVYYSAEIVKGSPVSDRAMEIGQRVGLAILAGLTFFAFYNDINRLLTG